jgi:uncharacterized protein (DUF2141 family)
VRRTLLLLALSTALSAEASAQPAEAHVGRVRRVRVTVVTRDDRGRVFCAMWRGSDGYPTIRARASHEGLDRTIRHRMATVTFDDVPIGEYAIACFHDENANNRLDTNLLGIPSEGTGASNDARDAMGPPPWDEARFRVDERMRHHLTVRIIYGW